MNGLRRIAIRLLGLACLSQGAGVLCADDSGHKLADPLVRPTAFEEALESEPATSRKTLFQWTNAAPKEEEESNEVEPLATDRPDFTEASSTVGRGVFQIEAGYTYTRDREDVTTQSHSWGEPLLRYGVLDDWLELRLAVFPAVEQVTGQQSVSGVEDLYLGAKLALTEQAEWLPEMALTPQFTVPIGSDAFTADRTLPGVNWLYGWDVTDWMTTAGSTQFNKAVDDDGSRYTEFAQSWTVGYSFSDDFGGYTEWFALVPSGASTAQTEQYLNTGLTYRFSPDVQWDIRVGAGLNDAAADFFTGTGLSIRFRPPARD